MKGNNKRVISDFKKRNQVPRKRVKMLGLRRRVQYLVRMKYVMVMKIP